MNITIGSLLLLIIVGGIAGWIAGLIMHRRGFGIVGNIIVGILGAAIGNTVMGLLGIYTGSVLGALAFAIIGAILLLLAIGAIMKKR